MFGALRYYYRFLLVYRWQFLLFGVCLVLLSIAESIHPYFYKLFIERLPEGSENLLLQTLGVFMLVRFGAVIFDVLTHWLADTVVLPASRDARLKVVEHIQDLDFAYTLNRSTGSLISAVKRGDSAFFNLFYGINVKMTRILVEFGVLLWFFSQVDTRIAATMVVSIIGICVVAAHLLRRNIRARVAFNAEEDAISGMIVDTLLNYETVKLFAKEQAERLRLSTQFQPWMKRLWEYASTFRVIDIVVGTLGETSLFLVLFAGLHLVSELSLSPAEYIMILGFAIGFYPRLFELIYELRNTANSLVDLKKYFAALNLVPTVKDPETPVFLQSCDGEIIFDQVAFSYAAGNGAALSDLSLRIRQGQSVAFVGHSGAGKSTLVKLVLRFFDVDTGRITLDGVDIRDMTKANLRSFFGVVPQEPVLFNDTIGYNIAYGAIEPSTQEIAAAVKMANLQDLINQLPNGLETKVGERGVKLSGGQKQRLAIARMILSNPDIIVFDEATSQLDSESERLIQEAFWKASENKTTLIIAHRLSSIVRADKIVVMDGGQIAEIGSHRELLRRDGLYAKYWRLQTEV